MPPNSAYVASNPGQIKVDLRQFRRAYPAAFASQIGRFALEVCLCVVLLPIGVAIVFRRWRHGILPIMRHFRIGDTLPGVVVDEAKGLVAVRTDLTKTRREKYPVIRIVSVPLDKLAFGPYEAGRRMPVVALYQGGFNVSRWATFDPIPVAAATMDSSVERRTVESIAAWEWDALCEGLNQLPTPFAPGLYFIQESQLK